MVLPLPWKGTRSGLGSELGACAAGVGAREALAADETEGLGELAPLPLAVAFLRGGRSVCPDPSKTGSLLACPSASLILSSSVLRGTYLYPKYRLPTGKFNAAGASDPLLSSTSTCLPLIAGVGAGLDGIVGVAVDFPADLLMRTK
jgi:hypothetical protein